MTLSWQWHLVITFLDSEKKGFDTALHRSALVTGSRIRQCELRIHYVTRYFTCVQRSGENIWWVLLWTPVQLFNLLQATNCSLQYKLWSWNHNGNFQTGWESLVLRPFLKERRMAFENFVVRNYPESSPRLIISIFQVVGREKEERGGPPLPDLLQVKTSNGNCRRKS